MQFLTVDNFESVRTRVTPAWQEEFSWAASSEAAPNTEPQVDTLSAMLPMPLENGDEQQPLMDALQWGEQLKQQLLKLKQHWNLLRSQNDLISGRMPSVAQTIIDLLAATQHGETTANTTAAVFEGLAGAHSKLVATFERNSLRLELFLRLIIGFLEMAQRMRRLKFSRFTWLNDQIIAAQATVEKLKARGRSAHPSDRNRTFPELERAQTRVNQYRRDLYNQLKRNEFADSCLKHEVGWTVRMCRSIPNLLTELQADLHQHYQLASSITNQ